MKTLTHRTRANANASIISMVQRFSDIAIIFIGLYVICLFNKFSYAYGQVLISLAVLVVFQMIGGITDFYRSWRGVKISSELILIIKNWTLSFIIALGISSLFPIPDVNLNILIQWYLIVVIGFVICRFSIRIGSGLLRKIGCNTRNVAVVGSLPAGINLLRGFMDEPWLGFVVRGVYDDIKLDDYNGVPYGGNINDLIKDAREGKLDRVYIALGMHDEIKIKNIVGQLTDTTCSVLLIPDIFTFNILQSRTEEINGVPVVPLFDTPLNGINMVVKRLEDIVVSSIILLLISPLLACIACAVKFTSPGQLYSVKLDMEWMVSLF